MKRNKDKVVFDDNSNVKIDHLFSITSIIPKDYEFSNYGESHINELESFAKSFCEKTQVDELTPRYLDGYINALFAVENSFAELLYLQHLDICKQISIKAEQDTLVCNSVIDFCNKIGGKINEH